MIQTRSNTNVNEPIAVGTIIADSDATFHQGMQRQNIKQ
jgi:hypothetical protein